MIKLNLGCGSDRKNGYVNVDRIATAATDVVWDLEEFPWPFEDNSAEEILLFHVLEHLGSSTDKFLSIMKELYRISADQATLHIRVPHPRSDDFIADPTHVRPITPTTLALFSKARNRQWQQKGVANTPLGLHLDVDFDILNTEYEVTPFWSKRHRSGELNDAQLGEAVDIYSNVVSEVRMVVKVHKRPGPEQVTDYRVTLRLSSNPAG